MKKINSSPGRYTFQAEGYIKRCEEQGEEPNEDYLNIFKTAKERDKENMSDPNWQKDNMEYDLRSSEWMCAKVKASDIYAQNLYAAMCNMQFQKLAVVPILKDDRWSASWRHAGGIIADMREEGDYIDWYCSGIGGVVAYEEKLKAGYVSEGIVTEEVATDLKKLGWIPQEWPDDNNV
jgi:hypothetical protein